MRRGYSPLFLLFLVIPVSATTRYLATNGNDGNTCTTTARCVSFNRAYQLSVAGDVVLVAPGTYGGQTINANAAVTGTSSLTPNAAANVTFKPESGTVTIGDFKVSSINGPQANHIALESITMTGFIQVGNGDDIHFTSCTFRGLIQIVGGHFVSIQKGDVGANASVDGIEIYPYGSTRTPQDILIEDSTIHDITTASSTDHPDAIANDSVHNFTLRRNKFYRNCGIDYRAANSAASGTLIMENNYFGAPITTGCAVGTFFTAYITGPWVIRYNTFEGNIQPVNVDSEGDGQLWEANIFDGSVNGGSCPPGSNLIAQYNVWASGNPATCGGAANTIASAATIDAMFVSYNPNGATGSNLALVPGALAIDKGNPARFPATDINGTARPLGAGPDAGAYEAGGAAPTRPSPPSDLTGVVN
jgi:hypothetical protein